MANIRIDPICGQPITEEMLRSDLEALRYLEAALLRNTRYAEALEPVRRKIAEVESLLRGDDRG